MSNKPPGLYWYNGDAYWKPGTLELEVNDKNQWRHTRMDHPAHTHTELPSVWYPHANGALIVGSGRGQWSKREIDDPYMETDF
jgi:hypothetical protein